MSRGAAKDSFAPTALMASTTHNHGLSGRGYHLSPLRGSKNLHFTVYRFQASMSESSAFEACCDRFRGGDMKKILIAIVAALVATTALEAQEVQWSGLHAGAALGNVNYTFTWTDTAYSFYGASLTYSKQKATPSIEAGWDWQANGLVFGGEVNYTFASIKREVAYQTKVGDPVDVLKTDRLNHFTLFKGRFGPAFGKGLVYATAGIARISAEHTWITPEQPNYTWPTFSNDNTGFVAGVGVEQRLHKRLSIRAEFLKVNMPEVTSVNSGRFPMEVSDDITTFRAGASFHF